MDDVRIFDAESPLDRVVEAGQDVLVLRNGKPVARLVPSKTGDAMLSTIDGLRALRAEIAARGDTFGAAEIDGLRIQGRR